MTSLQVQLRLQVRQSTYAYDDSEKTQMLWEQLNKEQEGKKRSEGPDATNEPKCKMAKSTGGGDEINDDSANQMEAAEATETPPAVSSPGPEEQCEDGAKHAEEIEDDLFEQNTGLEEPNSPGETQDNSANAEMTFKSSRMFLTCFVCKFKTFYKESMREHLTSKFHKEHFRFLTEHFPEPAVTFLQTIITNRQKRSEQYIDQIPNYRATICEMYEKWDLTREVGLEHFLRRTQAAHCMACDIYIPMRRCLIKKHLKTHDHKHNIQVMMERSKQAGLSLAQNILSRRVARKKLKRHLKTPEAWATGQWLDSDTEADMLSEEAGPFCGLASQAGEGEGKDQEAELSLEATGSSEEEVGDGKHQSSSKGMVPAFKEGPAEGRFEDVLQKREAQNMKESFFALLDEEEEEDDDVEGVELGEEELEEDDYI